jgi:two-component system, NarL family, nitrate/nitrite response regulator NarL
MSLNSSTLLGVPSARRTRVIVADPYPVIVHGVRKMLEDDPRLQVVAEASTMPSFRKKVIAEAAEVALVDWSMASQDLAATTELLQSDLHSTSMIFLTVSENSQAKREMVKLGAHGFLSKWTSARKLQKAVFKADERRLALASSAAEAGLAGSLSMPSSIESEPHRIQRLTQRELQLLPLVCSGLKNKEIALQLGVAETTVWHHLTAIFTKLQVNDRLGVATFVYRHHLVPSDNESVTIPSGSANVAGHTAQPRRPDHVGAPGNMALEPLQSRTLKYPSVAHWASREQRERSLHGSTPRATAGV